MAEEVLVRQAKALGDRTGQPFETSLVSVGETQAGRQLRELANSAYSEERAANWQASLPWQSEPRNATTRSWRATWSGWKARRPAPNTTRLWRRNSLAWLA